LPQLVLDDFCGEADIAQKPVIEPGQGPPLPVPL
jgi:hypothetical protein